MRHQISWRKSLPLGFLFVFAILIFSFFSIANLRKQSLDRYQAQLLDFAQRVSKDAQPYFNTLEKRTETDQIAFHFEQTGNVSLYWLDLNGYPLKAGAQVKNPLPSLTPVQIKKIIQDGGGTWIQNSDVFASWAVESDGSKSPSGFVLLKSPLQNIDFNLKPLYFLGGMTILVTFILAMMMISIIKERSLKPVENLVVAIEQMRMGNFHHLDFPDVSPELLDLSTSIQELAFYLDNEFANLTNEHTQLSAVLNQMSDGVLIADPDGRIQLLNPAAEHLFQVGEKAGLGRSVVEVLRYQPMVDVWRTAKTGQRESTMLEIGAQRLFLQVTGMPLKTLAKGTTLMLFQNFTQVRRLETVRRDFISNVSHELRTPLASLKALAETLQEGALDDPPAARRFITRMETEIDNLTMLVNDLLELSRIESGRVPLAFHRAQPCDLLNTAYERMVLQTERAGLTLVLDCPEDLPLIFADTNRISQVIINLVHNSIKFTAPGGKIIISAYHDGEFVVFFVKDTGVGMPKEDLARIFERFYKADRARSSGGTGLGLSISRHMVESHGGLIWAESEENLGSTVYFSLPIA